MKRSSPPVVAAAALLAVIAGAACRTAAREPGPAADARPVAREEAGRLPAAEAQAGEARAGSARPRHTGADVRFVQGMMAHHAQALAMTSLVPTRSRRDDVRLLAQRIEVSQQDEIAQMRRWLEDRGEKVPGLDAHHAHHAPADSGQAAGGHQARMPGMLTAEELARLARATGDGFDRLFLEFMIRHHEGALTMVAELFATPGAGQEAELFGLASDVDADQRAEIARMRTLLNALPAGAPRR